jgi:peptide/nickel transport system substrate-binding protein
VHVLPSLNRLVRYLSAFSLTGLLVVIGLSGGGNAAAAASAKTLSIGISDNEINPDPAVYYNLQGVMVTDSLYEGLIQNTPGSTTYQPLLATKWTVSPDGLTYTFTLRSGVTYSDGTPVTSTNVEASFQRFLKVGAAPSYMLAEVSGYQTPTPTTLIITLSHPVNNFLDRLASPWGPKAVSPEVVADHSVKGDLGQAWMETHADGTGPYLLSSINPTQEIDMTDNPNYWGTKPYYSKVKLLIIPNPTAQRLALENKTVNAIEVDDPSELNQLGAESGIKVAAMKSSFNMDFLTEDMKQGIFTDRALAAALALSVDRSQLVTDVYGKYATLAGQTAPPGMMPKNEGLYTVPYKPNALAAAVKKAHLTAAQKVVTMSYITESVPNQEIIERLAVTLKAAGLTPKIIPITDTEYFNWLSNPKLASDIFSSTQSDDGAHPDNWYRLFFYQTGALNYYGAGSTQTDALMDTANSQLSLAAADKYYNQLSNILEPTGELIPLANVPVVYAAQSSLKGLEIENASPQGLVITALHAGK